MTAPVTTTDACHRNANDPSGRTSAGCRRRVKGASSAEAAVETTFVRAAYVALYKQVTPFYKYLLTWPGIHVQQAYAASSSSSAA
jgi:hypothetical protein